MSNFDDEFDSRWYSFPNRTLCQCLEEMRSILKAIPEEIRVKRTLHTLVEEVQVYANRMEAALEDQRDIRDGQEKKKKLKIEIKELQRELKFLNKVIDEDE